MTNPTPEQVEEAKAYLKQWADHTASCRAECEHTILSALEGAEKERDKHERKGKELCILVGNLKDRAEKAEKDYDELLKDVRAILGHS